MKKLIIALSTLIAFGILFIIIVLPVDDNLDCLTKDQIIDIKSNSTQSKDYRLVAEISGSHEKVVLISLYPNNVTFDGCGRANQKSIKEEIADEKKQIDKIVIGDKKINLTYVASNKPVNFENITVIWE